MAEFRLPENSRIVEGRTFPAPADAKEVVRFK
ncbi:MAG TPA: succinate dehydrogenase iron-sulfur subunit, partial [Alphaproteobacteria bacterium]